MRGSMQLGAAAMCLVGLVGVVGRGQEHAEHEGHGGKIAFDLHSARSGRWSNPTTWEPQRVPGTGDRVLVRRGDRVLYDVSSDVVVRLVQIVGELVFARDRDTLLNVGVLKVQDSEECSESGFACDFQMVNTSGEPQAARSRELPLLEIGSAAAPIPAERTARVRLHFLDGMSKDDAPALVCCSARMEIHGAPLSRTWLKLGEDADAGARAVALAEPVSGWRVGDEVIVTGSKRRERSRSLRERPELATTELRRIERIDGATLHLDRALGLDHSGSGEFRSEVANLSRNVVVESADPNGVRGHTLYHRFSRGSIGYARFAHLGKEGTLGRYPIHFHIVDDTMRGASVVGAAIVDSHNRWITIHGTSYLVVRDCVGYKSVGHGFFLEDGTEVYNVLDRNLGVHAFRARPLRGQVLPFDPNDGAAFWWGNGRNTIVRNVTCENDEYGFRYDMQRTSRFSSELSVRMPDGEPHRVDVRTLPIWRFEDNEAHTEGLYGAVVAANGNSQPDTPIRSQEMLERIRRIDWTGPDTRHPHVIRGLKIWEAHYAFRPHSPAMLVEGLRIDRTAYGVYRPALENHVYRDVHLSRIGPEPFNRGMDDASAQTGSVTVDGLVLEDFRGGDQRHPIIHMSDNDLGHGSESHFRRIELRGVDARRPLFNRGGSVRADPFVDDGVPVYVHDHYGSGRHARIVSTKAADLLRDGREYRREPPLTGDESVVAEVGDVRFPELLEPTDDVPPATVILSARVEGAELVVRGIAHDDGEIARVEVNDVVANVVASAAGVVDWEARMAVPVADDGVPPELTARSTDAAGNVERTPHRTRVDLAGGARPSRRF